jgi:hypothetical protein
MAVAGVAGRLASRLVKLAESTGIVFPVYMTDASLRGLVGVCDPEGGPLCWKEGVGGVELDNTPLEKERCSMVAASTASTCSIRLRMLDAKLSRTRE